MRVIVVLVLVFLFTACSDSNTIPAGIIPKQKMETILWQLALADEYSNKLLAKDSLKKKSVEKMKIYQQVFDLNETSLSEYKKSYQFYMAHPDISKVMFDSVAVRAGRQRSNMYNSGPRPIPSSAPLKPAKKP